MYSECQDGAVQLEGGGPLEGRLELCINSAWGTVCNNLFSNHDAAVACHQLGFQRNGQYNNHTLIVAQLPIVFEKTIL